MSFTLPIENANNAIEAASGFIENAGHKFYIITEATLHLNGNWKIKFVSMKRTFIVDMDKDSAEIIEFYEEKE